MTAEATDEAAAEVKISADEDERAVWVAAAAAPAVSSLFTIQMFHCQPPHEEALL